MSQNSQHGFTPVLILLVVLAVGAIGGVAYVKIKSKIVSIETPASQSLTQAAPSAQPTTESDKPTPIPTSQNKSSTPKPTTTPKPTPTPTPKKNPCSINVTYGKLGGGSSDPLLVTLISSFSSYNNTYMTGAQWDFDGNGSWDTDLKQSNGIIEHTYGRSGTYNPRLQLQASDGSMTNVCTKGITVPSGITVRVTGRIYADTNCNTLPEPNEVGVGGAPVVLSKMPEYSVYAETTTDGGGNFSFSQNIQPNDSLNVSIDHGVVPSGYKSNPKFNPPTYGLGGSQTSMNIDIPIVPIDSINAGACY
ncbi:MAG: PKD domain-containing protein [Patescibacteria group bacterium]